MTYRSTDEMLERVRARADRRGRRHRIAAVGSIALVAAFAVGLASRQQTPDRIIAATTAATQPEPVDAQATSMAPTTTSGPSPTVMPSSSEAQTPELFGVPTRPLTWEVFEPSGSMARSHVSQVVAGPGGFVATGIGFDGGQNQGRVWFSSDGRTWVEPAPTLFHPIQNLHPLVGTGKGYFVFGAAENPRSEVPMPPKLYRSPNGVDWEELPHPGGPDATAPLILWGASGRLYSVIDAQLRASWNGTDWSPVSLPPSALDVMRVDEVSGLVAVVRSDGLSYEVATSDDGTTFELAHMGQYAPTAATNVGYIIPICDAAGCHPRVRFQPLAGGAQATDIDMIPPHPQPSSLFPVAGQLVSIRPDGTHHTRAWTSPDGRSWTQIHEVVIDQNPSRSSFAGSEAQPIVVYGDFGLLAVQAVAHEQPFAVGNRSVIVLARPV